MKRTDIYSQVTDRILKAMEQGTIPWRQAWQDGQSPRNAISKKPYNGINLFLLSLTTYSDPRWLTFKQAAGLGGNVRKGEHGIKILFWRQFDISDCEDQSKAIPVLREYTVFNVQQCDSLNLPELVLPPDKTTDERYACAAATVAAMQNAPTIGHGGNRACYSPKDDHIQMPPTTAFHDGGRYWATLFHELGHATGHETRLNRPGITEDVHFGSERYSHEELIAEFASAFMCARLGIDNRSSDEAASYIQGWSSFLRDQPRALVSAAGKARKAAEYILGEGRDQEEAEESTNNS